MSFVSLPFPVFRSHRAPETFASPAQTWFQRFEKPTAIESDHEEGAYLYFDYKLWNAVGFVGFWRSTGCARGLWGWLLTSPRDAAHCR